MRWTDSFVELDKTRHERSTFDCGEPKLNDFIKTRADRHKRAGISKTMVLSALEVNPIGKVGICAFYTLSPSAISAKILPKKLAKTLPLYPVPVFLIAQLAVHLDVQGQGFGKITLIKALEHLWAISKHMPAYAVVVDCLHDELAAFYRQFGFTFLCTDEDKIRLFLPMKIVGQLFEID